MSITLSTFRSPNIFFKNPIKLSSHPPLFNRPHHSNQAPFDSFQPRTSILRLRNAHKFPGLLSTNLGLSVTKNHGFLAKAENGGEGTQNVANEVEIESRGESSMPERFRSLTKEAPDKPVRWPFLIVLAFLLYAWRAVLWELSIWKGIVMGFFRFIGTMMKFALANVLYYILHPVTASLRFVETILHIIRTFYSGVIKQAPIQELTKMIILASLILAIAEATVPDSVNSQPYLLTVAGFIGFVAAKGYISELFFWTVLLGLFSFGRWVKKRDYVSSALPVAAVLAAVGEPWIQALVMISYTSLAIVQHSREPADGKEVEATNEVIRAPFPLLCVALAIGMRLAASWAGYRHLTWMIV
ncbi:PREDICTED: uncharacterized protein LOC109187933 isoform X1 [Ipomoea nil]|uniref:uncharacterized protein LOC109187933 isoform X1 n=1 Tax=Ipomoea nil TaxID=35883 RepID=UPI0009012B51|nr:PREDICTED: uncharacterized protein LOC109187933 isoform X1 [Ipomoea nil]